MKIEALVSFCGVLTMAGGEVREYSDEAVLSDLLKAGYIKEVKEEKKPRSPKKAVSAGESK